MLCALRPTLWNRPLVGLFIQKSSHGATGSHAGGGIFFQRKDLRKRRWTCNSGPESVHLFLSTRSRVIPSYQGESIIFHNEKFLQLQVIAVSRTSGLQVCIHPPQRQKRESNSLQQSTLLGMLRCLLNKQTNKLLTDNDDQMKLTVLIT